MSVVTTMLTIGDNSWSGCCSIKGQKCSVNLGDSLGTEHLLVMSMIGLVLLAA